MVRKRKVWANDLYRTVIVSGLFQMRTPESKAFVEGSALAKAEPDCSDELSRQCQHPFALRRETVGLGFHLSL